MSLFNQLNEILDLIEREQIAPACIIIEAIPKMVGGYTKITHTTNRHIQFELSYKGLILELELESSKLIHYLKWKGTYIGSVEGYCFINEEDHLKSLFKWFENNLLLMKCEND